MEFEAFIKEIENEYSRLEHGLSWRFLTSPKSTLNPKTEFVFVTLNPGGDTITHEEDRESCENGSPYLLECWKHFPPGEEPLQKQIQLLFDTLGWEFDSVLSGQLVPFRSPSWKELPKRKESLQFGIQLWSKILKYVKPSLVVAMGKSHLRSPLVEILGTPTVSENHSVGWGNITASKDIFPSCALVSLPHLSRFQIMGRPASHEPLKVIFNRA